MQRNKKDFKSRFQLFLMHPLFPLSIAILAIFVSLLSIGSGWILDDVWHRISYADTSALGTEGSELYNMRGPMRTYAFLDGSPERARLMIDKGLLPWWANTETKISFWRPVSALLLNLDYALFPERPQLMHVHAIIWFVILCVLVSVYFREIFGVSWMASLAAILFVVDFSHSIPVTWLANRHAIIAAVFSVASLLVYHKWALHKKTGSYFLSCGFFILGLLSSEIGLAALAYILAYAMFISKENISSRIKSLLPYIIIIILWRVIYNTLGYGASGSETYIDPVYNPVRFTLEALVRLPILLISVWGSLPAEIYMILSPQAIYLYSGAAWILVVSVIFFTRRFWLRSSITLFWLTGMICAVIPPCAAMPGSRNLELVGIGGVGFMVQLFRHYLSTMQLARLKKTLGIFLVALLGMMHLVIAPLTFEGTSIMMGKLNTNPLFNFGEDSRIAEQDVILVDAPGSFVISFLLPNYFFRTGNMPNHLRILSPGFMPLEVKRTNLYTLVLRPTDGYYSPPGTPEKEQSGLEKYANLNFFLRRIERFPQDGTRNAVLNQKIYLTNVTIEITELTQDGRPAEVKFHFAYPLEDQTFKWLIWNKSQSSYQDFTLPQPGDVIYIE